MRKLSRSVDLCGYAVLALTVSCATMISGTTQKIKLTSVPSGAVVTVDPGGHKAATPAELVLDRKGAAYTVIFEKEGYRTSRHILTHTDNGWVWGNILLGGIIGIVVDSSTGAAYKITPESIHADLVKIATSSGTDPRSQLPVLASDGSLLAVISFEN